MMARRSNIHAFFPTRICAGPLQRSGSAALNRQLLRECLQLREDDGAGRRWSATNYPGGYTSYATSHRLQRMSPTFDMLRSKLQRHVKALAADLEWDLTGRTLEMTDCWVNIMGKGVVHGMHLHPLSSLSGTYYVRAPAKSSGLKLEDPRLDRFMAAPPRRKTARRENQAWITLPAQAGSFVLFESWLRHEVAPNPAAAERVSVSFNYNWF